MLAATRPHDPSALAPGGQRTRAAVGRAQDLRHAAPGVLGVPRGMGPPASAAQPSVPSGAASSAGAVRERLHTPRARVIAALVSVAVIGTAVILAVHGSSSSGVQVSSRFITGTPEAGRPVRLDASLYLPVTTPAPAVLLSQGFGGDKTDLNGTARTLAGDGFVVLTYSARGCGRSGGLIHFASPSYEVQDGSRLLDYLSGLRQVRRVGGKPQLATAGASYGGGLSLLIAAYDHRVGAVAADITWNDLSHALFPNNAGPTPGPFAKLWE